MAFFEKTEVAITSEGHSLSVIQPPTLLSNHKPFRKIRYIEAEAGKKFALHVKLLGGFRFYGANGISCSLVVDGRHLNSLLFEVDKILPALDSPLEFVFEDQEIYRPQDKQWLTTKHAFKRVDLGERNNETDITKVKDIGKIEVHITRVIMKPLQKHSNVPHKDYIFETVENVPEQLLKGKIVDTSVSFVDQVAIDNPTPFQANCKALRGQHGHLFILEFRYLSRTGLQRLGVIPYDRSRVTELDHDSEEILTTLNSNKGVHLARGNEAPEENQTQGTPSTTALSKSKVRHTAKSVLKRERPHSVERESLPRLSPNAIDRSQDQSSVLGIEQDKEIEQLETRLRELRAKEIEDIEVHHNALHDLDSLS
ncbi:MAG: hypothetical protein M1833_001370 [Piccolia ochrophora]|nr:MAG: hypothetical protein M1833_001370 [Piccolia ochrophora]